MADSRDAPELYWVEPKRRGVLPLERFHVSRSLRKTLQSGRFETTLDAAFGDVVQACAAPAADRDGTWINSLIEEAVLHLHARGQAHSIETWQDGKLVGGLYGIRLGRAFFGESMFSRETDASKVALAHLVARLRVSGFTLLDCQFLTPHLASLGAEEISRSAYMSLLSSATGSALGASSAGAGALDDLRALDFLPPFPDEPPSPRTTCVPAPVSTWRIWQALVHTS